MRPGEPAAVLALSPEHYAQLGGLSSYLRHAVSVLDRKDSERQSPVTFLGRSTATPLAEVASAPLREPPVAAASRRDQIWKAVLWALRCRLRRRPAFLLCGHLYLAPLALLAQRLAGGRALLVLLGLESWEPPPRAAARRAASNFDLYVSVSRFTTERFSLWSGADRARITLVPPAVDPQLFRTITRDDVTRCRAELGIGDRPALLTVARLDAIPERKGHDRVLRILPALRERYPGLVYLLAGDGPGRESLQRQSDRLGLSDAARFLGPVSESEKAVLYRLADAFVLPSEGEGFGIALAEAAVSRLPIVYSRLDASAEAVSGAERTWPIDPRSPPDLLEALDAALQSGRRSPTVDRPVQGLPHCAVESFEQAWGRLRSAPIRDRSSRPGPSG